jgi:hypothetical protein
MAQNYFVMKNIKILLLVSNLLILYSNKLFIVPGVIVLFLASYNDGFFFTIEQTMGMIGLAIFVISFVKKTSRFIIIVVLGLISIMPITHLIILVKRADFDLYFFASFSIYLGFCIYFLIRLRFMRSNHQS